MSPQRLQKLMAYTDGELEGAERVEIERLVANDPEAARFVQDLVGLGEYVQLGHREGAAAKAVAGFDVADAVIAKVAEAERGGSGAVGRPISLEAARTRRQQQLKIGGIVAGALALAASLFLITRTKEVPMGQGPTAQAPTRATVNNVEPAPSNVVAVARNPAVEVDAVESPGSSVSVFYLPSSNEMSTSVVVWVDEPGAK